MGPTPKRIPSLSVDQIERVRVLDLVVKAIEHRIEYSRKAEQHLSRLGKR